MVFMYRDGKKRMEKSRTQKIHPILKWEKEVILEFNLMTAVLWTLMELG